MARHDEGMSILNRIRAKTAANLAIGPITEKTRLRALEIIEGASLIDPGHLSPTGRANVDLMHQVLDFATREEKSHGFKGPGSRFNMSEWFQGQVTKETAGGPPPPMACGTTACLAGTAVAFTLEPGQSLNKWGIGTAETPANMYSSGANGWSWLEEGGDRLGLTFVQADFLFRRITLEIDDIKAVASFMTGFDHMAAGVDAPRGALARVRSLIVR